MGTDQVLLHRFVISQLTDAGLDRDRLIRETGLPEWTMVGADVHLPSHTFSRLWELGEHGPPSIHAPTQVPIGPTGLIRHIPTHHTPSRRG